MKAHAERLTGYQDRAGRHPVRLLSLIAALAAMCVLLPACEKDEGDWADELLDARFRQDAMVHIKANRANKKLVQESIPRLTELIEKGIDVHNAVVLMGDLGDPAAVPFLLSKLKEWQDKDHPELDRLTEEACIALGQIGEKVTMEPLIAVIKSRVSGPRGKKGALQALGMIGDPKAAPVLIDVVRDDGKHMLLRHYAMIALGKMRLPEYADDYAWTLFVDDETGLNLFRDGQTALLKLGGQPMRDALIKLYNFQNEKVLKVVDGQMTGLAVEIDLGTGWVQIKAIEVMGHARDPELTPFMIEQFLLAVDPKNDLLFEVMAKLIQALGRAADPRSAEPMLKVLLTKPISTDFLAEKEMIANAMARIGNVPEEKLEEMMKIVEEGEQVLFNPDTEKKTPYPQWPIAVANLLSQSDWEGKYLERMESAFASGKIKTKTVGMPFSPEEFGEIFKRRMQVSRECRRDPACYAAKVQLRTDQNDKWHWAGVERAVYALGHLGDTKYQDALLTSLAYDHELVLEATVASVNKLMTPDFIPKITEHKNNSKLNQFFQKPIEDLGYLITIKRRDYGLLDVKATEDDAAQPAAGQGRKKRGTY